MNRTRQNLWKWVKAKSANGSRVVMLVHTETSSIHNPGGPSGGVVGWATDMFPVGQLCIRPQTWVAYMFFVSGLYNV